MADTSWDAMQSSELYLPSDEELTRVQQQCLELLYEYNQTRPGEAKRRTELLRMMFAQIGDNCYIEPPFHANWGGRHVHFGSGVYANFNMTLVDDGPIYVGDGTMFGPNVTVATAQHPLAAELRRQGYQYNRSVHIGKNCWLGSGVIVLPGVTIGDNTVIGAGSVVTRDIPAGVVADGTPCRPIKKADELWVGPDARQWKI